ncbi:MAG: hypothetical protein ACTHLE_26740 [Agriterribacter sp.]
MELFNEISIAARSVCAGDKLSDLKIKLKLLIEKIADKSVLELMPFNPRAMKAGEKQLQEYINELMTMPEFKGINWTKVLYTY